MKGISLNKICRDFGIRIFSYQGEPEFLKALHLEEHAKYSDGFALYSHGIPIILFNEERPPDRIRRVVAHELGHLVLGHLTHRLVFWQVNTSNSEREADIFAMMLLADELLNP